MVGVNDTRKENIMEKKMVKLNYEVLADVISKVGVLASSENKVRFEIGKKDTGNGLQSFAMIVNGGAMISYGFMTLAPAKPVEIPADAPYMKFILKARDFVTYAGALLPYKADVTVTEEEGRVVFGCLEGTKVPVAKVSIDAAEPLLENDVAQRTAQIKGEAFMETIEKAGFFTQYAQSGADSVVVKVEDGRMDAYSAANIGGAHFKCGVEAKIIGQGSGVDAKTFILTYAKSLGDDKKESFKAELAEAVNDAAKVKELAKKYGWTEPAGGADATAKAKEVKFALNGVNWRLLAKLFGGNKNAAAAVTPKNLHVFAGALCATFALSVVNEGILNVFNNLDKIEKPVKMVMDKEALLGTLALMKLGDKDKPVAYKATKTGIGFEKMGAEITGRATFVASSGDLAAVKGAFNNDIVSNVVGALKAGNVLLGYAGEQSPMFLSNGNLETEETGYFAVLGVKVPSKKETPKEAPKAEAEAGDLPGDVID